MHVKIAGIAAYVPENIVTTQALEQRLAHANPTLRVPHVIELISGVKTRHYASAETNASDLAVAACQKVLAQTDTALAEIDLLIFASASQDLTEPATAHIVQAKLGTAGAVLDVKNACNSFLNGLQVAEALILTGQYRKALVAVGEVPSKCIKWDIADRQEFRARFTGYTFGDAGAAALLEASPDANGLFYRKFMAVSQHWHISTLAGGGSMHPRGDEYSYFLGDGTAMKEAFVELGTSFLKEALAESGTCFADFKKILVQQATVPFLETFLNVTKIPPDRVVLTLPEYGNMAAATLPLAFWLAESRGEIQRGDKVMLIGLAGGISAGIVMFEY